MTAGIPMPMAAIRHQRRRSRGDNLRSWRRMRTRTLPPVGNARSAYDGTADGPDVEMGSGADGGSRGGTDKGAAGGTPCDRERANGRDDGRVGWREGIGGI